jgi:hypothetical protein
MPKELGPFSRRQVVGGLSIGLAVGIEASAFSQTSTPTPQPVNSMQDPVIKYPKPPFKRRSQPWPGLASKMDPTPDHGETSYKGSGRLAGRRALITGRDSGMAARLPSPTRAKAPTSPSTTIRTRSRTPRT